MTEIAIRPGAVPDGTQRQLLTTSFQITSPRRSFVSKYLHFHRPAIPIYDSVASKALSGLMCRDGLRTSTA